MKNFAFLTLLLLVLFSGNVQAQEELAKQSQNPLGTVISLPFENNVNFGIGPSDSTAYILNLKPVYPIRIGEWNLINRLIAPIIYTEGQDIDRLPVDDVDFGQGNLISLAKGSEFGLGDITYQAFFSPATPSKWIWGVGPAFQLPTATAERYESDKWSGGLAAVALTMPGSWVVGALVQNVWSFAGDSDAADVNQFLFQYFLNYNLDDGWYLSSSPNITANWEADSSDRWTVPLGGGVGRLIKIGKLPVDFKLTGYYNIEALKNGPDWSAQFTVKFLFPK